MIVEKATLLRYLEELTPGGSEFSNSPKACFQWIKQRLSVSGKVAAERNALREELTDATAQIQQLNAENGVLLLELQAARARLESNDKEMRRLNNELAKALGLPF